MFRTFRIRNIAHFLSQSFLIVALVTFALSITVDPGVADAVVLSPIAEGNNVENFFLAADSAPAAEEHFEIFFPAGSITTFPSETSPVHMGTVVQGGSIGFSARVFNHRAEFLDSSTYGHQDRYLRTYHWSKEHCYPFWPFCHDHSYSRTVYWWGSYHTHTNYFTNVSPSLLDASLSLSGNPSIVAGSTVEPTPITVNGSTDHLTSGGVTVAVKLNVPVSVLPGTYLLSVSATDNSGGGAGTGILFFTITVVDPNQQLHPFLLQWGSQGSGDGQFAYPTGVTVDSAGNVYVAEFANHRIQEFDSAGAFLTKWGSGGSGDGQFQFPRGVAIDSAGNVYVADKANHRIQKFDSNGIFLDKWGSGGSGDGQFLGPQGVAVDSAGNVYVTDSNNHRIQKFDSTGVFLTKWGSRGSGDGQFQVPMGVAVDSAGNVYVTDFYNHRIQKFDSTGAFLAKWGSRGSGDGQFHNPIAVAVDSAGNVYVADNANHRIQKFDSAGAFLTKWGSGGSGDGQFNGPVGVAIDSAGNVYVSDTGNHRIQKFGPPTADTTAPVVIPPADQVNEATSTAGAIVTYPAATATDDVGVTSGPSCSPLSGSTFPLGASIVTCTASDASGNEGSAIFTVTVQDTTPPTIVLSDATAPADGFLATQTFVIFPATLGSEPITMNGSVSDNVGVVSIVVNDVPATVGPDGYWTVENVPLSAGDNPIDAIATDTSGNTASASVHVTLDLDLDGDGIRNNVDKDPLVPSTRFSDEALSGITSGRLTQKSAGVSMEVIDEPDPQGVRIVVSGPGGGAKVKIDGSQGTYTLGTPGEYVFTSGSVMLEVLEGRAEVEFTVDNEVIVVGVEGGIAVFLEEPTEQAVIVAVVEGVATVNGVAVHPGEDLLVPYSSQTPLIDSLQSIVDNNPGTPLADKLEDAIDKLHDAFDELNKMPPDNQAAVGSIEGAVGDLEAAVGDGLLDSEYGTLKMDLLAGVAHQLAVDAINQAIAKAGDPTVIAEAQQYLAEGDALRTSGIFKDAVNKYKDALAKAESVG